MRVPTLLASAILLAGSAMLSAQAARTTPKFYDNDPIARVADTQDATKVQPREISLTYDAVINLFGRPGLQFVGRAEDVNTIDEVPDSSWFTNRAGTRPFTADAMSQGVNDDAGPQAGVDGEPEGQRRVAWLHDHQRTGPPVPVKFDPPGQPELATGAEVVVARIFHALGYNVPQALIATLRRDTLVVGKDTTVQLPNGHRRPMNVSDIDEQLRRAERNTDGSYRVMVSEALEGTPLQGFKYEGTRPDNPNDIVPHENRRELRGLRVFSAWVNHTDAKAINSMDTLVKDDGQSVVRHASSTSTPRSGAPASDCASDATATSTSSNSHRPGGPCRRSVSTSGRG